MKMSGLFVLGCGVAVLVKSIIEGRLWECAALGVVLGWHSSIELRKWRKGR